MKKREMLEWRNLWRQKLAVVGAPKAKVTKKVGRPASPKTAKAAEGKAKAVKGAVGKGNPAKGAGATKGPAKQPVKESIVGDLVRQLRKGQKTQAANRPTGRKASAATAEEVAYPAGPPSTRRQEQELIDAAIQVSLREGGGTETAASRPAAGARRVKFAGLNGFTEGPSGRKGASKAGAARTPAVVKGSQPGPKKRATPVEPLEKEKRNGRRSVVPAAEEAVAPTATKRYAETALEGADDEEGEMPAGFRLQLGGPGRRKGSVEWLAECRHGIEKLSNGAGLQDFFQQHSKCRSQWKQFARHKREAPHDHAARLAAAFPLTKAAASSRGWEVTSSQPPPQQRPRRSSVGQKSAGNRELAALMAAEAPPAGGGGRARARKSLASQGEQVAREAGTKRRSLAELSGNLDEKPPPKRARGGSSSREQSAVAEDPFLEAGRRTTRGRDLEEAARRSLGRDEAAERASPSDEGSEELKQSSSGSDTFVPADCDLGSSSDEDNQGRGLSSHARRPQARPSRNTRVGIPKLREPLEWGSWRNQNQDDASDESCISEGSCPSLFSDPEPPKPAGPRRLPSRQPHRPAARATAKNIVAAARQRVKKRKKQA